jgi:hypothetical protein
LELDLSSYVWKSEAEQNEDRNPLVLNQNDTPFYSELHAWTLKYKRFLDKGGAGLKRDLKSQVLSSSKIPLMTSIFDLRMSFMAT